MDVFKGCICGNCGSVMFADGWSDASKLEVKFSCPRGCEFSLVRGFFRLMTSQQLRNFIMSLCPELAFRKKCWNCQQEFDSRQCKRDKIFTLGFYCPGCKKSLRQSYEQIGLITKHEVDIPPSPKKVFIELPRD